MQPEGNRCLVRRKNEKLKTKMDPTPYDPAPNERELVATATAFGADQKTVARWLKVSQTTLRKHFRDELDQSMEQRNNVVINTAFQKAQSMDSAHNNMTIYWLKTQCGFREFDPEQIARDAVEAALEYVRPVDIRDWNERVVPILSPQKRPTQNLGNGKQKALPSTASGTQ